MKGKFKPTLQNKGIVKSDITEPISKKSFKELQLIEDYNQGKPIGKQLKDLKKEYSSNSEYNSEQFYKNTEDFINRSEIAFKNNTILDYDKYTGSMGSFPWTKIKLKSGIEKWTGKDIWDINPLSRLDFLPKPVRKWDAKSVLGGNNIPVQVDYMKNASGTVTNMHPYKTGGTVINWLDNL